MKFAILPIAFVLILVPQLVSAAVVPTNQVQIATLDQAGNVVTTFDPFGNDYRGSVSMATGDMGGDGVAEIIVGAGPGLKPIVKTLRQDGSEIFQFLAYDEKYQNGLTVSVCDVNDDKINEIITGTMFGGEPRVKIFNSSGQSLYSEGFLAYSEKFKGGVNVTCGDVDADGKADIITGAGLTGGPHIKVFSPDGIMKYEIFAGSASENSGVTVASADIDGNGDAEIISGRMGSGDPIVMIFDLRKERLSFVMSFLAFADYKNGVQVTSGDIDNDGKDEIGVATNRHEKGLINFFKLTGAPGVELIPFNTTVEKKIIPATISKDQQDYVLAASAAPTSSDQLGKYIKVDVSDQTLYAYENGVEVKNFLVSTGTYAFPTPYGKTQVYKKVLWKDYAWSYGEGNPNNYSLPGVKYNLQFRPHMYIHYAYWHNNFGHRRSHGCINVNFENAEWIYNWADVGIPVEVVE